MSQKTKVRLLGAVELIVGAALLVAMFVRYTPGGWWLAAMVPGCALVTVGFFRLRDGETTAEMMERSEREWVEINERNRRNGADD